MSIHTAFSRCLDSRGSTMNDRYESRVQPPDQRPRRAGGRAALAMTVLLISPLVGACGSPSSTTGSTEGTTASPAAAEGTSYESTTFVVPFDMTPPSWLDPAPSIEEPHFVTWEAPDLPAVRFLAPVDVYRPGADEATELPSDYLTYLLGQRSQGAHFADQTTGTVGGQPATFLTATTDHGLDGSLGCPAEKTAPADCFGLQKDLALRMAVIDVHGTTLLVWLRMDKSAVADEAARMKSFDDMLASVAFTDRTPEPAASTSTATAGGTPLDGDYRMTVSWPDTKSADARCVGGPEGKSPLTVYELSLDQGIFQLWVRIGGPTAPRQDAWSGTFAIQDDVFSFDDGDLNATYTYDGRKLVLTDLDSDWCGDRAIWTTKPWVRQ